MSLRILIVSDHYPPFIGGAHRQTQLLAKELYKRGHHVAVATVWQPGTVTESDDEGVQLFRLKDLRTTLRPAPNEAGQRHHPPYPDPVTMQGLRQVLAKVQPDVIHAYGWFSYSLAAALGNQEIPLLISARDYAYGCATRTLVYQGKESCSGPALGKCLSCAAKLYGRPKGWAAVMGTALSLPLLKRKVKGIHSISTYVREMVHRDFADDQLGPLVEATIPSFREDGDQLLDQNDPALQPYLAQLPNEPYILFVGALRRVKGIYELLAAYQRLQEAPPLVLIGTREADSPQVIPPGVHILPNFPHRAVMAAWTRAAFGVIPSLWAEPLGSVVYEGMSQGKAVIGTRPGGHTDMITDGETGLLVGQGDVTALATAMQTLIDNPQLCQAMGKAAQSRAELFVAAQSVPRFEQLYYRLVEQRQPIVQSLPAVLT